MTQRESGLRPQRESALRAKRQRQSRGPGARGEAFLQAGDESYPIVFTNRAIFQAERVIDKTVLQITSALSEQTLSMGDLVRMLLIGLEAGRRDAGFAISATRQGNRPYALNDAWDIMDLAGFRAVVVAVFAALAEVLSYSQEANDQEPDESPPGE